MQVQVMRSQVAAIIAGGDADNARDAGGPDADAGSFFHSSQIQAIDDNLVNRVDAFGHGRLDLAAQGRAVGVIGAGAEFLVSASDLAAGADDATRKGQDNAGDLA